ncbi:gamma-glutamyl-gamma-aminobutyrate hydrolase family protein [Nocardioides sp. MAH-18]|uniref:Gamma-glutamyl-gamma-aminobutyrate hydrolase family protein n=1 Tax=Nocardioides agri TaxID=2682843 RepID=A0A6L6XXL5_9ACTN|nr:MULTISPECIES: gamma-glutamyl-gamma-aminobutyrate hydrolase family protein [unclassified Nocardioides]MBA2952817.1 gamma-glutamyl-gamma-aminobutyrate hydrolase family protein [Nocardioides sp. CGMCC 1.13656]MVQ51979.1 gamma-glutamyl-gamma-aminobutyrate hydrolase family protein [Nocardioides sp. MAH-18]
MPAPVIGLTTYREDAAWGVWQQRADLLPAQYAAAVEAAGGVPLLLPPVDVPGAADAVAERLDGLVISGGADVEPGRYDAEPHPRTTGWRPDRDAWELALLDAAEAVGLPVLGVCRGMQVMAVRAGGTLDQHVPDLVEHEQHSPGGPEFGAIEVTTTPGSRLAGLVGDRLAVSCHHHQSVRTHPGFAPVAHAADGTLEAMEANGERFCVGVQWHPETAVDVGLLAGLVRAAAAYNADR